MPSPGLLPDVSLRRVVRNGKNKPRRLVVGDRTYLYSIGHEHRVEHGDTGAQRYFDCTEIVSIRLRGATGRILIAFRAGEGRIVSDGILPGGTVGTAEVGLLNLHEPGTVRALLDEAIACGWNPDATTIEHLDGWRLFDAGAARRLVVGRRSA
jgi:hypothetical protein